MFPFNIISQLMKGDNVSTNLKEAESKEDEASILPISNSNYYDGYLSLENRLSGSSLSEISLNNLYNFLTDPEVAAANLILTAGLEAGIMLIWFLPTFLWSGVKLDESDRPFQTSKLSQNRIDYDPRLPFPSPIEEASPNNMVMHNTHFKKTNPLSFSKRISTILETVTTRTSFSKVYNGLLCPQCIARIGLINGAILTGKLVFWSFISMLPREDFDPWYIRPFENFFKSRENLPVVGPLNENRESTPRSKEFGRSHHNSVVRFFEGMLSVFLTNVEDWIKYVNKGIL